MCVVILNDCIYLHAELQLTIIFINYYSADSFLDQSIKCFVKWNVKKSEKIQ